MLPPNYFTCTLDQGLEWNVWRYGISTTGSPNGVVQQHDYSTVTEFVDWLAAHHGHRRAAGCLLPLDGGSEAVVGDRDAEVLTFEDVRMLSRKVAPSFRRWVPAEGGGAGTVALLASSSMVFLLMWLGLMRAGFHVLLVAPQSSKETVCHLLELSEAVAVFHDAKHEELARLAVDDLQKRSGGVDGGEAIRRVEILWKSLGEIQSLETLTLPSTSKEDVTAQSTDVAFSFHSSGTTGLPKLIPQTHHGAVGILPRLQDRSFHDSSLLGTFTTTPLYHGGIADLLRCWSAGALIWLFPEDRYPITGSNVKKCLDRIRHFVPHVESVVVPLGYLSCVPFVLEMLAEETGSMELLRWLRMVGTGGAAMPRALGDQLISEDVKLVSRFGSSECGFLLSSARDFAHDTEWNVLRVGAEQSILRFEGTENGEYELIVPREWPLVSNAGYAQRPYHTHDVFLPHSSRPNAWLYVGRSDSQMTLKTGEKLDPSRLEAEMQQNGEVKDAVVVGEGKPYPGLIVFPTLNPRDNDGARFSAILAAVRKLNSTNPSYARIHPSMVTILPADQVCRLQKNNKGGVIRSSVATDFSTEIDALYSASASERQLRANEPEQNLGIVQEIVSAELQLPNLDPETSLFDAGLDSGGAIRIRNRFRTTLPQGAMVPMNLAYECGSVRAIADYLNALLDGRVDVAPNDQTVEMQAMVQPYVDLQPRLLQQISDRLQKVTVSDPPTPPPSPQTTILLTGATGFLGVHILATLLPRPDVSRIYVLTRASPSIDHNQQVHTATARLLATLTSHHLLPAAHLIPKITVLPFILHAPDLGLALQTYHHLTTSITHIVHAAWEVNFTLPLKTFAPHVAGLTHLFTLAVLSARAARHRVVRFTFCSSLASVAQAAEPLRLAGMCSTEPGDSSPLGYSRSKWVAERVLDLLSGRGEGEGVETWVVRVGQLAGGRVQGVWNRREAWPLVMAVSLGEGGVGGVPDLRGVEGVGAKGQWQGFGRWLPVDVAAAGVVDGVLGGQGRGRGRGRGRGGGNDGGGAYFRTVANTVSVATTWGQLQEWIVAFGRGRGRTVDVLEAGGWLERLEGLEVEGIERLKGIERAKSLIGVWRENWVSGGGDGRKEVEGNEGGNEGRDGDGDGDGGEGNEVRDGDEDRDGGGEGNEVEKGEGGEDGTEGDGTEGDGSEGEDSMAFDVDQAYVNRLLTWILDGGD